MGRCSSILWSSNIQVSHVIVYNLNISALTIPITINMKDKSIKTIAFIDYEVEGTFIYKKLVKQY